MGNPPYCKPECMRNSDCKLDSACVTGNKCSDPCTDNCGLNTDCKVVNHRPVCACLPGYTGDPFVNCNPLLPGNKLFSAHLFLKMKKKFDKIFREIFFFNQLILRSKYLCRNYFCK